MEMEYAEYLKCKAKTAKAKNIVPQYIPSKEDIEQLVKLTKEKRAKKQKITSAHGRRYEYENSLHFIEPGKVGEPCIKEESLYMYLIFILKTAKPRNDNDRQNLEYIDSFVKENLKIKKPKEM